MAPDPGKIREIQARTILTPQNFGSLSGWYDFTLNPYAGCAFRCSYCYVPKFPSEHSPDQWGDWVNIKINAPELIRRDRLKVFGSRIFFSSATDPYQYLELKYRLTRRCLQELLRYQPRKITMHTRSHLIVQDLELLKAFGSALEVGVSITTDREDVRAEFEPGAPSISQRIKVLRILHDSGIKMYASLSPLLPCDTQRLVRLIKPYVDKVWTQNLNYAEVMQRPHLLEKYKDWFNEHQHEQARAYIKSAFKDQSVTGSEFTDTALAKIISRPPELFSRPI